MAAIGAEHLSIVCAKVKARRAPATAVHVRGIVRRVFGFAAVHGEKARNPTHEIGPSSIATFVAKGRCTAASRNPRPASGAGRHRDPADRPLGPAPDPADARAQERADRGYT